MLETTIQLALFHPLAITLGLLLGICMYEIGAGAGKDYPWISGILQLSGIPVVVFFLTRFVKWVWFL